MIQKIFLRACLIFIVGVLVITAAWILFDRNQSNIASDDFVLADSRSVQNAVCSGDCDHVSLTSDEQPGVIFVSSLETSASCIPVTLWANRMREDQIGINGFAFYKGWQKNLAPVTVNSDALDGRAIPFSVSSSSIDSEADVAVFDVYLRDSGDWNLIDSEKFDEENGHGFSVSTDYESGSVTLFDGCGADAKEEKIYALYQDPEVVPPGEDKTYFVSITRRGIYGASEESQDAVIFEKIFSSVELQENVIHIRAVDGEITFDFDLVRE
ncbi:MAG: hypothetical protein WCT28_04040 [Patescibacteria group bacterium]|jgi:hypothetical protein